MQRVRDLKTLNPKWDVFTTSIPVRVKKLYRQISRRIIKASKDEKTKGAVPSKHTGTRHIWILRDCGHIQGLYKAAPDGLLAHREGKGTLTMKKCGEILLLANQNQFFSVASQ